MFRLRTDPVDWGSRMHWLHLCTGVRLCVITLNWFVWNRSVFIFKNNWWPCRLGLQNTLTASLQRGKTPQTSIRDMTLTIRWWGSCNAGALWNVEYPSLPSLPGSLWPGVVASDRILSIGQIELICVITLNWFVWN